jgi:hypothetical protein
VTVTRPGTKASRQAWVAATLADRPVRSQEELARLLAERGMPVTQATLSRDLEELGAVRVRGADGSLVYALPTEPGGPGSRPGGVGPGGAAAPAAGAEPDPGRSRLARSRRWRRPGRTAARAGRTPPLTAPIWSRPPSKVPSRTNMRD